MVEVLRRLGVGSKVGRRPWTPWHVDVAVLARDQQGPLIPKVRADPGWRLVYEDAEGLIFRRVPMPSDAGPADDEILRSSR